MMKISRKMEDVAVQNTVCTSVLQDLKKPLSISHVRKLEVSEYENDSFKAFIQLF